MSKESALAMAVTQVSPQPVAQPAPTIEAPPPAVEKTVVDGEAGVVEAPKVEEPPKELDSTKLTHLIKKETELVKQREAFKKEQEAFTAEKEKLKEIQAKLTQFEELRKKDPLQALKLLEFSEADLINFMAGEDSQLTPEEKALKATRAEIDKFKKEQEERELQSQKQKNEQIITQFKSDITKHVTSDKDTYEFINHHGETAQELIYDTINQVYGDTGELITIKEAADMVESFYEESFKSLASLKKVKPKTDTPPEEGAEVKKDEKKETINPTPSKTLTNKTTATSASTTVIKRETPSEKKERLIRKYLKPQ